MVRRWVTTGRLPVRKEPVGINQRTRLVRASDVSLIRPIIDPTAAITDDIHKLDLLSIPRQQEQIKQDQQQTLKTVQEMHQQIDDHFQQNCSALAQVATELQKQTQEWNHRFTMHQAQWHQALHLQQQQYEGRAIQIDHQIQELQQQTSERKEQATQQQQALASITDGHATMQNALQEAQHHLQKLDQDAHFQMDQISHDFTTRLMQQEKRSQNRFGEIEEVLAYDHQAHKQMQQHMEALHQEILTLQETLLAGMERQRSEIDGMLQRGRSELQHERTAQYEYMKFLEQRLASVERQIKQLRRQRLQVRSVLRIRSGRLKR